MATTQQPQSTLKVEELPKSDKAFTQPLSQQPTMMQPYQVQQPMAMPYQTTPPMQPAYNMPPGQYFERNDWRYDYQQTYFDNRSAPPPAEVNINWRFWRPRTDIFEEEGNVVIEFELPGVKVDEISVTVVEDTLTLQSVKNRTPKEQRGDYVQRERHFGNFYRRVVLPDYVDASQRKAVLEDGVLKLTMPIKLPEKGERATVIQFAPYKKS